MSVAKTLNFQQSVGAIRANFSAGTSGVLAVKIARGAGIVKSGNSRFAEGVSACNALEGSQFF